MQTAKSGKGLAVSKRVLDYYIAEDAPAKRPGCLKITLMIFIVLCVGFGLALWLARAGQ